MDPGPGSEDRVEEDGVDMEQQIAELAQMQVELQSEVEAKNDVIMQLKTEKAACEATVVELRAERDGLLVKVAKASDETDPLRDQLRSANDKLAAKEHEAQRLQGDVEHYKGEADTYRQRLAAEREKHQAAEEKLRACEAQNLRLEAEHNRISRDVARLEQENRDYAQAEGKLTHDYFSMQTRLTREAFALQGQLTAEQERVKQLEDDKQSEENQNARNERKIQQLQEARHQAELDRQVEVKGLNEELAMAKRLAHLAQERQAMSEQELNDKNELLKKAQGQMRDMEAEFRNILEREKNLASEAVELAKQDGQKALEEFKRRLEQEEKDREESVAVVQAAAPGRAMASLSAAIRDQGIDVLDVQNRVVTAENELQRERAGHRRTKLTLDHLLKALEEKYPELEHQKMHYRRAIECYEETLTKLRDAGHRIQVLEREQTESQQAVHRLTMDQQAHQCVQQELQQKIKGLTKENHVLKVKVRQATGGGGVASVVEPEGDQETASTLEALQDENVRLRHSLHQMEIQQNEYVLRAVQKANTERDQQLAEVLHDFEALREDRHHQSQMFEQVVNERDMFKAIVAQNNALLMQAPSPRKSAPGTPASRGASPMRSPAGRQMVPFQDDEVARLQNRILGLEEELKIARQEVDNRRNVERQSNEQLEKVSEELRVARGQGARAEAEANYYKQLLDGAQQQRQEDDASNRKLRDQIERLQRSVVSHQQETAERQQQLEKGHSDLARLSQQNQHLKGQVTELRKSEAEKDAELLRVKEAANKDQDLASSLRSVLEKLQEQDDQRQRHLEDEIRRAGDEATMARHAHTDVKNELTATQIRARQAAEEAQRKLDRANEEIQQWKSKTSDAQAEAKNARDNLTLARTELEDTRRRLDAYAAGRPLPGGSPEEIAERELKLQQALDDAEDARKEKEQAQQHMEGYQAMAEAANKSIKEMRALVDTLQQDLDSQVKAEQEKTREAAEDAARARTDLGATIQTLLEEKEQANATIAELRTQREELNVIIAKMKAQGQTQRQTEGDLRRELAEARAQARENQDAYAVQVQQHAAAMDRLMETNRKVDAVTKERDTARAQLGGVHARVDELRKINTELNQKIKSFEQEAEVRMESLKEENTRLHEQVTLIMQELERAQKQRDDEAEKEAQRRAEKEAAAAAGDGAEAEAPSAEDRDMVAKLEQDNRDLRESVNNLVRLMHNLRKDKEAAELHKVLQEAEVKRLRASYETVHQSLSNAREELQQYLKQAEDSRNSPELQKLRVQVADMTTMRESHLLLGHDNRRLQTQVGSLETKLRNLRNEQEPSKQENLRLKQQLAEAKAELAAVREENGNWKSRVDSMLRAYNPVDPEELRKCQEERDGLLREKGLLQQDKTALARDRDELRAAKEAAERAVKAEKKEKENLAAEIQRLRSQAEEGRGISEAEVEARVTRVRQEVQQQMEQRLKQQREVVYKKAQEAASRAAAVEESARAKALEDQMEELRKKHAETMNDLQQELRSLKNNKAKEDKLGANLRNILRNMKAEVATLKEQLEQQQSQPQGATRAPTTTTGVQTTPELLRRASPPPSAAPEGGAAGAGVGGGALIVVDQPPAAEDQGAMQVEDAPAQAPPADAAPPSAVIAAPAAAPAVDDETFGGEEANDGGPQAAPPVGEVAPQVPPQAAPQVAPQGRGLASPPPRDAADESDLRRRAMMQHRARTEQQNKQAEGGIPDDRGLKRARDAEDAPPGGAEEAGARPAKAPTTTAVTAVTTTDDRGGVDVLAVVPPRTLAVAPAAAPAAVPPGGMPVFGGAGGAGGGFGAFATNPVGFGVPGAATPAPAAAPPARETPSLAFGGVPAGGSLGGTTFGAIPQARPPGGGGSPFTMTPAGGLFGRGAPPTTMATPAPDQPSGQAPDAAPPVNAWLAANFGDRPPQMAIFGSGAAPTGFGRPSGQAEAQARLPTVPEREEGEMEDPGTGGGAGAAEGREAPGARPAGPPGFNFKAPSLGNANPSFASVNLPVPSSSPSSSPPSTFASFGAMAAGGAAAAPAAPLFGGTPAPALFAPQGGSAGGFLGAAQPATGFVALAATPVPAPVPAPAPAPASAAAPAPGGEAAGGGGAAAGILDLAETAAMTPEERLRRRNAKFSGQAPATSTPASPASPPSLLGKRAAPKQPGAKGKVAKPHDGASAGGNTETNEIDDMNEDNGGDGGEQGRQDDTDKNDRNDDGAGGAQLL